MFLVIMSNPIMALLSKDVLTGDNFPKWKSNLNIVLVSESIRFILTEDRPPLPAHGASKNLREDYDKWTTANNKAVAYMLASISDALQTKMEGNETAVEILDSLQQMFGMQSEQARIELTRKCTSTRMTAGTPVRDHVMKMTNYFTEAELHGAQMDEVTQVGIILNSLSSDFIQFTSNYIMNKLTYGLSQLLNELQTFESITRHGKNKGSALYADKSSSPKTKKKLTSGAESSKARPNTSKGKGPAKKERKNFKRSGKGKEKKRESIGKCNHCNTEGHWKRHCPLYLAELEKNKKNAGIVP